MSTRKIKSNFPQRERQTRLDGKENRTLLAALITEALKKIKAV